MGRSKVESVSDTGALVRAAQAGDTQALGELVAAHLPLVYNETTARDRWFVRARDYLGVGSALAWDQPLVLGPAELGHLTVHPDGQLCPCGSRGCLQGYASPAAVLGTEPAPPGSTPEAEITARADAGRPDTLAALDAAGTALGVALADILNILDIGSVLLGGSFSLLASWLTANARTEIDRRVLTAQWAR